MHKFPDIPRQTILGVALLVPLLVGVACTDELGSPTGLTPALRSPLGPRSVITAIVVDGIEVRALFGGMSGEAMRISESGHIGGISYPGHHARYWANAATENVDIPTLGGTYGTGMGVNDAGAVIGYAWTDTEGDRAFIWTQASGTVRLPDVGDRTRAYAINSAGVVVGQADIPGSTEHAWIWHPDVPNGTVGTTTDLGNLWGPDRSEAIDINDAGVVVGWRDAATFTPRPVTWSPSNGIQQLATLSGGGLGYARSINGNGDVAGYSTAGDGTFHATLWKNGASTPTDLNGSPGCTEQSYAYGINDLGWVAGQCGTVPVVWSPDGMIALPGDPAWGTRNGEARDINNSGEVVGQMAGTSLYWKLRITQPQAISFTSTPPSPALLNGNYLISANGGASGNPVVFTALTPTVCSITGTAASLIAVGSCTIAANQAGNASYDPAPQLTQTFSVVFAFAGFFEPVDNLPTVNVAQAGSAIPIKFSLGGDKGLSILAQGSPSSTAFTCNSALQDVIEETISASTSGLRYDGSQYIYVWKTDKSWARSCRQFLLKLTDGTTQRASFQFR